MYLVRLQWHLPNPGESRDHPIPVMRFRLDLREVSPLYSQRAYSG
jgi:hypothetical protein